MLARAVGLAERPLTLERLLVPLDFAVDLRATDGDQQVAGARRGGQLAERAVAAVDEGVVGEQPPGPDPVRCVEGERALDERGDRRRPLVGVELAVGVAGSGRRRASARTRSPPASASPAPVRCRSPVTACPGLVKRPKRLLSMCSKSPGHGHSYRRGRSRGCRGAREIPARLSVRHTVACASPVSPAISRGPQPERRRAAQIRSCSAPGQEPWAAMRSRRAILEAGERPPLLGRRLRPAPPPLAGGRRRDATASRRLPDTNSPTRRPRPVRAGRRVRDERYGEAPSGSSFACEPSQTHSLEGGPDDLL